MVFVVSVFFIMGKAAGIRNSFGFFLTYYWLITFDDRSHTEWQTNQRHPDLESVWRRCWSWVLCFFSVADRLLSEERNSTRIFRDAFFLKKKTKPLHTATLLTYAERITQTPPTKYHRPLTSAQVYGWDVKPLVSYPLSFFFTSFSFTLSLPGVSTPLPSHRLGHLLLIHFTENNLFLRRGILTLLKFLGNLRTVQRKCTADVPAEKENGDYGVLWWD